MHKFSKHTTKEERDEMRKNKKNIGKSTIPMMNKISNFQKSEPMQESHDNEEYFPQSQPKAFHYEPIEMMDGLPFKYGRIEYEREE